MAPPRKSRQRTRDCHQSMEQHTDRNHLHVSAMKTTLELVHVLGDDAFIYRVELTPTTVFRDGALAPVAADDILFDVHVEVVDRWIKKKWNGQSQIKDKNGMGKTVRRVGVMNNSKYGGDSSVHDPSPSPLPG
jgi:hypothetical protein